jgi:hypothetical protein
VRVINAGDGGLSALVFGQVLYLLIIISALIITPSLSSQGLSND